MDYLPNSLGRDSIRYWRLGYKDGRTEVFGA